MKLEIRSRHPKTESKGAPLLFVHGAYMAAWVWEERFLLFFAEHGYAAHAVSLRGHGESEGRDELRWTSLGDYVADVEQAVRELGTPPVLIGHSMGGMVVQKYAVRHALPGMVLMASVPPGGLLSTAGGLAIARPLHLASLTLLQALGPRAVSKADMRRIFFSDDIPDPLLDQYCARMQPESQRAVLDLVAVRLSACCLHDTPVLVVGGERDALIPSRAFRDTARHYGVQARIIPGVAHAMMLETGWRAVADRLLRWLEEEVAP